MAGAAPQNQQPSPVKEVKWEPLLDHGERDHAWNCGQSLDSKKVTSALGYLDVKQICYCLAQALAKHIQFSQGFFFLNELQAHTKKATTCLDEIRDGELEFTYELGD